jgi:hypothetical protein
LIISPAGGSAPWTGERMSDNGSSKNSAKTKDFFMTEKPPYHKENELNNRLIETEIKEQGAP